MSLKEKAMLVSLKISIPSNSKKDKQATEEVTQSRNAQDGSYTTSKKVFMKEDIKAAQQVRTRARQYFDSNTLPWTDRSQRLLPSAKFIDFVKEIDKFKDEMEDVKADFIANITRIEANSASFLGDGFDTKDIPSIQDLNQTFTIDFQADPFPDVQDFRCELSEYEKARLAAMHKDAEQKKRESAMQDMWTKLYEPLKTLADRLDDPDTKRYCGSLITNVMKMTDLLPQLNVFDDDNLNDMCQEIRDQLADVDIKDIKKDDMAKKDLVRSSNEIMDRMAGFMKNTDLIAIDTPAPQEEPELQDEPEFQEEPEYQEAA